MYNLIELGIINVNTFIGYNFVLGQLDSQVPPIIHNPIVELTISIFFVGLEYSYYIPTKYSNNITFHHISIGFHFTNNITRVRSHNVKI